MDAILFKSLLYDFYGKLLTERQQYCFTLYHFENLTLTEIGQELDISAQAVSDLIRRTQKNLEDYEQNLGIVAKYMDQKTIMSKLFDILDSLSLQEPDGGRQGLVTEIKKYIEQLLL